VDTHQNSQTQINNQLIARKQEQGKEKLFGLTPFNKSI